MGTSFQAATSYAEPVDILLFALAPGAIFI
jgi:hypothetical protein